MSLHSKQATLVIIEQQSLPYGLFQQSLDRSTLELDDLLLTLVHETAECSEQDLPWLQDEGHVRR